MIVILGNSIFMAMDDPTKEATDMEKKIELVFLILYTIEMCLKIGGLGFVMNKKSYLRFNWNVLDFIIVTSAYVPYILTTSANISVLRYPTKYD